MMQAATASSCLLLLRRHHDAGGYSELLPVQTAAWSMLAGGHSQAHDLCLCAPTGSGKTLAYALPIVQALARYAARCYVATLPSCFVRWA